MIKTTLAVMGCAAVLGLALALAPAAAQGPPEGQSLVQNRCTVCHNLTRVRNHIGKNDRKAWNDYVSRMQKNGARVTDAEKQVIVDYLASLKSGKDL
uniref:Quinohemoprotein amine dehydrogenase alpha subunit haem binding domain-containing protein n=1 Tax=Desulfacinum infernum TaxID=35837 RepID=A0A832EJ50_9BACT